MLRGLEVFPAKMPEFDVRSAPGDPVTLFLRWLAAAVRDKVLGPHAPNLTSNEVNLLHRLWLRFSDVLAPQELHHHDVVHFALEEVKKEIEEGEEDAVVKRLRDHLDGNQSKKSPSS